MRLVNVRQLAPMLKIATGNVAMTLKRHGIAPAEKEGRTYLFDLEDVKRVPSWAGILGRADADLSAIAIRRQRSDRGMPRNVSERALQVAVALAKDHYMSSGMPDLRLACESALKALRAMAESGSTSVEKAEAEAIDIEWFYRRWVRRRDQYMLGPYHQEGWRELWNQKWKQHDSALNSPVSRRVMWKIFESAGWAGQGYGFGHMVVLDDRSADVWTTSDDGLVMPNGIYVWDVLTGALLFVEPAHSITTHAYIRAIAGAMCLHSLTSPPLVILENAKAAKSVRINDLIEAIYPESDLQKLWSDKNIRKLFNGEKGPIFRNVPHIAREVGKAFAERSFGVIKREHDARFSPATFQGGNRDEAVQIHRSNMPWHRVASPAYPRHKIDAEIPTMESYFLSLWHWSQNEYLERERASLKQWAKEKGLKPQRRDMVLYYGGGQRNEGEMQLPTERIAMAIYAGALHRSVVTLRTAGHVSIQMNGRMVTLASVELGPELVGRKLGIVELPGQEDHFIIVCLKWQSKQIERYVDICRNVVAETIDQAIEDRSHVRSVRETLRSDIDQKVRTVREQYLDITADVVVLGGPQYDALPAAPEWIAKGEANETEETEVKDQSNHLGFQGGIVNEGAQMSDDIQSIMDL